MENQLITLPDTRLTPVIADEYLYPVFYDSVSSSPFLTSDIRNGIITKWQSMLPNIRPINLKVCLSKMERSYFENLEVIDRAGLRNRILEQQSALNEMAIVSDMPVDKKIRAITESNKLSANVAGLSEMPPQIEIVINTNAPSDLAMRMNKSIVLEQAARDADLEEIA